MIKAVLFDFDGVIINTEKRKFHDLSKLLVKSGYKVRKGFFGRMVGKKTVSFLKEEYPKMPENEISSLNILRRKMEYLNLGAYKMIPGLKPLLGYLRKKGIMIGIVTGSEHDFVTKILREKKLLEYFSCVVSGEQFTNSKPDPECYIHALRKMDLSPSDAIVIEDSKAGAAAAENAGMRVFLLNTYVNHLGKDAFDNHVGLKKHLSTSFS